jgi:hypothetical protein
MTAGDAWKHLGRPAMLVLALCVLSACSGPASDRSDREHSLAGFFGPGLQVRTNGSFGIDRGHLLQVDDPRVPPTAVRVDYPGGSVSPAASRKYGSARGGMQVYLPSRRGPQEQAYLRYWVRFPSGFDFVKGGKLPGLWGGSKVSGGATPDGTDGFSTRLMWRRAGAGEVYLYAADTAGASLGRGDWTWPTGRWSCVEQHVVLNEPRRSNGTVVVWIDGHQVLSRNDLRYRSVPTLQIEGIFFSTFFGGADPTWASPRDQFADFAGFALSDKRLGCRL